MAVSIDLDKALDKAWENKSLAEILAAPPSALAGLTERHDEILATLGIKTIAALGSNTHPAGGPHARGRCRWRGPDGSAGEPLAHRAEAQRGLLGQVGVQVLIGD